MTKKTKLPWWQLPQDILDKAVEDGIDYTNVEWYVEVDGNNRKYGFDKHE